MTIDEKVANIISFQTAAETLETRAKFLSRHLPNHPSCIQGAQQEIDAMLLGAQCIREKNKAVIAAASREVDAMSLDDFARKEFKTAAAAFPQGPYANKGVGKSCHPEEWTDANGVKQITCSCGEPDPAHALSTVKTVSNGCLVPKCGGTIETTGSFVRDGEEGICNRCRRIYVATAWEDGTMSFVYSLRTSETSKKPPRKNKNVLREFNKQQAKKSRKAVKE